MLFQLKNVSGSTITYGSLNILDNNFIDIFDDVSKEYDSNIIDELISSHQALGGSVNLNEDLFNSNLEYYEDGVLKTNLEFYNFWDTFFKFTYPELLEFEDIDSRLDDLEVDSSNDTDYTTAGLTTTVYVDNTFTTITDFDSATSGINTELVSLDSRIDDLELNNPDYTTAGLSSMTYVDSTFTTITDFDSATSGINTRIDDLENGLSNTNDYTTAGLTTTTYVDSTFATITDFDSATSGINTRIDDLENGILDHTTAGYLLNIEEDTTPTLGGDLNTDGFNIYSTNGLLLNNIEFPLVDGTNSQILTTDGNGKLSFVDNNKESVFFEFGLTEEVLNTNVFFYSWRTRGSNTGNSQRSNRGNGLNQNCSPIMIPYNVKLVGATLVLKTSGVNNTTVTFPVTYKTNLYTIGFDNSQDPLINGGNPYPVQFSIPSGTVGTFAGDDTESIFELNGLDVDLDRGQMIGLEFEAGTGASEIAISQMAFISLHCIKR